MAGVEGWIGLDGGMVGYDLCSICVRFAYSCISRRVAGRTLTQALGQLQQASGREGADCASGSGVVHSVLSYPCHLIGTTRMYIPISKPCLNHVPNHHQP